MYLFTRAGRLVPGSMRQAMEFVGSVTEEVRRQTELDVHAWTSMLSPSTGTTVWAAFVDDLEQLEVANDKLATTGSYLDIIEKGSRLFEGPFSDGLAQVVFGEPDPTAPLPNYVARVKATAVNGQLTAAMENGVKIAETVTQITGVPTAFLADVTGAYGGCRWTTGFSSIAELERAESALMADQSWLSLIDRAGTAYTSDAHQTIYRRIH